MLSVLFNPRGSTSRYKLTIVLLLERRIWRKLTLTWRGNEATVTAQLPRREGLLTLSIDFLIFPKLSLWQCLCVSFKTETSGSQTISSLSQRWIADYALCRAAFLGRGMKTSCFLSHALCLSFFLSFLLCLSLPFSALLLRVAFHLGRGSSEKTLRNVWIVSSDNKSL